MLDIIKILKMPTEIKGLVYNDQDFKTMDDLFDYMDANGLKFCKATRSK